MYNLPIAKAWEVFYGILHRAVTQTKPFRNKKTHWKREIPSQAHKKAHQDRRKSYRDYKASGSLSRLAKLQKLSSKCRKAIRNYNKDCEREEFQKIRTKSDFYNLCKRKLGQQHKLPALIDRSDMVHKTSLDKANALVEFFASTFTVDDGY